MKQFASPTRESATHRREEGYILLTMLLVVSLMSILALAVITEMKFSMQRDQEQEMIHRGVQYSRAVRGYFKKFGRYPTRLEDLDNTSNFRYLRKHYKDPINKNQDFRLLHFGEQGVTVGSGGLSFGGGTIPGANPVGGQGLNGSSTNGSAFGGSSFGGGNSSFGNSGNNGVNTSGVFAQSSGFGGNSNNAFGANSNNAAPGSNAPGTPPTNGTDASVPATDPSNSASTKIDSAGASDQSSGQQLIASGPIVGVASISKKTTIREFNKKKKYNEWQFVYDPTNEPRNGLITTPNQPQLQGFGSQPGLNGGQPANNNSPFGQSSSSGFGQSSSGFGNNPNSNAPSAPVQTPANPPQPQ